MDGFLIACIFVFYAALLISPALRMWVAGAKKDLEDDPPDQPIEASWLDDLFPADERRDDVEGKPAA